MDRIKKITQNGKTIILVDLSNAKPEDVVTTIPLAYSTISTYAAKSALVLTNVTNATYNKDVAESIKNFVKNNTPYIRASAVVGAEGVRLILLNTVIFLTRREIKTFNTLPEALTWLASH